MYVFNCRINVHFCVVHLHVLWLIWCVLPITEEHFRKNGLCLYFSLLIAVMVPSLVSETVLLVTEPLSAQWCGNLTGGL